MKEKPGMFQDWAQVYSFALWTEFATYGILALVFALRHNTYAWVLCGFLMFAVARILGMLERYHRDMGTARLACREVWEKYSDAYKAVEHAKFGCERLGEKLENSREVANGWRKLAEQYEEVIERHVDCRTLPKQWREYRSSEQSEPPFVQ